MPAEQEPGERAERDQSSTDDKNNNDGNAPRGCGGIEHDDSDGVTQLSPMGGKQTTRSAAPDGGVHAWLTLAGSFCVVAACFGLINSVGILQAHLETHQLSAFSSREVGWIPATSIFLCLFLGVQVGPLFDAFGPRWPLAGGSVFYVAGLVIMSFLGCGSCGEDDGGGGPGTGGKRFASLLFTWGVVVGSSAAVLTTTALGVIGHWFDRKRGVANGVVFLGSSVGGITFPLVMKAGFHTLGWPWTVRIVALIVSTLLATGNLLIRGRLSGRRGRRDLVIDLRCLRDSRVVWTTAGTCMFEFVLIGALGMLPTWIRERGFDEDCSFNVVALVNAGSGVGRIAAGALSDYIGRYNMIILMLVWLMAVTFAVWSSIGHRNWMVYLFGALYGMGTGSLISLSPNCIATLCVPDDYGRFYGTTYSIVSIFGLMCIPLSATILDSTGSFGLVLTFGGFLTVSLILYTCARWACLDYKWRFLAKV